MSNVLRNLFFLWNVTFRYRYEEIDDYDYNTARSRNGKPVGHFTQLVWRDTKKIGVGIASGRSRLFAEYGNVETFIVAKYSPQGNFHWRGNRYRDYSSNVLPRYNGGETCFILRSITAPSRQLPV